MGRASAGAPTEPSPEGVNRVRLQEGLDRKWCRCRRGQGRDHGACVDGDVCHTWWGSRTNPTLG